VGQASRLRADLLWGRRPACELICCGAGVPPARSRPAPVFARTSVHGVASPSNHRTMSPSTGMDTTVQKHGQWLGLASRHREPGGPARAGVSAIPTIASRVREARGWPPQSPSPPHQIRGPALPLRPPLQRLALQLHLTDFQLLTARCAVQDDHLPRPCGSLRVPRGRPRVPYGRILFSMRSPALA